MDADTEITGENHPYAGLPRIEELPIPLDVIPDRRWSPMMLEMADHIGPYAVLRFCECYGGCEIRVSPKVSRNQFRACLTAEQHAVFVHVFARNRINVPVATAAILAAKRAGILALVRTRQLTIGQAAYICRTPRNYIAELVNGTREGFAITPTDLSVTRSSILAARLTDVVAVELASAGLDPDLVNARLRRLTSTILSNMENAR